MKMYSIPYFIFIHATKCQLLLLYLTYAFVGRTQIILFNSCGCHIRNDGESLEKSIGFILGFRRHYDKSRSV